MLSTKERRMNAKSRRLKRPSASRRRKNVRCKGSEICKSALTTVKPNLMQKGLRKPMKRLSLNTEPGKKQSNRSYKKMFRDSTKVVKDNSRITTPV